jgi:hypothetical protein
MPFNFGKPEFFEEMVRRFTAPGSNSKVHVLLHSTNGNDSLDEGAVTPEEPFELADRIWLCKLPDELRDTVYRLCEPSDEPVQEVHRQYGQLYTAALFMGPNSPGVLGGWDGYGYLSKFVTFSQLLHPTSIGFGNTAIFTFGPDGKLLRSEAGPCRGITGQAFVVPNTRNWLSMAECERLKNLFHNTNLDALPDRVARAHWSVQHAAYQYFFEVRTLLVASGLDALVHARTSGKDPTTSAQFIDRTVALAKELGIPFTTDDANGVWTHRSDVSHGRDPWEAVKKQSGKPPELTKDTPLVKRYMACEQILRSTVLKCLAEPKFASKFKSDQAVANAYPVALPPSKKRHKP